MPSSSINPNSYYVIADSYRDSRTGLKELIRKKFDLRNIKFKAFATCYKELFDLVSQGDVKTVILNPFIDGYNLSHTPKLFRQHFPAVKILVNTPEYSRFCVYAIDNNLFDAYILKNAAPKIYEDALHTIHIAGEKYYHADINKITLAIKNLNLPFTPIEWDAFYLMLQFKTPAQISTGIKKSLASVKAYISKIYYYTQTANNQELIQYARHHNLTSYYELDCIYKNNMLNSISLS